MPFGKVLAAIVNKHARLARAMLERDVDYDPYAWENDHALAIMSFPWSQASLGEVCDTGASRSSAPKFDVVLTSRLI
jgi:hypothetical protein